MSDAYKKTRTIITAAMKKCMDYKNVHDKKREKLEENTPERWIEVGKTNAAIYLLKEMSAVLTNPSASYEDYQEFYINLKRFQNFQENPEGKASLHPPYFMVIGHRNNSHTTRKLVKQTDRLMEQLENQFPEFSNIRIPSEVDFSLPASHISISGYTEHPISENDEAAGVKVQQAILDYIWPCDDSQIPLPPPLPEGILEVDNNILTSVPVSSSKQDAIKRDDDDQSRKVKRQIGSTSFTIAAGASVIDSEKRSVNLGQEYDKAHRGPVFNRG